MTASIFVCECNEAIAFSRANGGIAVHCDACGASVRANRQRTRKAWKQPRKRGVLDLLRDARMIARREQIESARAIDYNPEVRGEHDGVPAHLDDASARGQQAHADRLRQRLQQIEREHDDGGVLEGSRHGDKGTPVEVDAVGIIADALSLPQDRVQWAQMRFVKDSATRTGMALLRSEAGEALIATAVRRWWR